MESLTQSPFEKLSWPKDKQIPLTVIRDLTANVERLLNSRWQTYSADLS
jgi:hypothetical protein